MTQRTFAVLDSVQVAIRRIACVGATPLSIFALVAKRGQPDRGAAVHTASR